jgi:hypothetical protein
MGKEVVLEGSPISLETLAHQTEEEWEKNWQNPDFVKNFPRLAAGLVSPDLKPILTDEQREEMVRRATKTFILPILPGKTNFALQVNENLDVTPTGQGKKDITANSRLLESLGTWVTGDLILLGKSLKDKEHINNILSESYGHFDLYKKSAFRTHVLLLLKKDSLFRNWVKTNQLDSQNGFEWSTETAKLFLFLWHLGSESVNLPTVFGQDLKIYTPETLEVFIDYAKDRVENGLKSKRILFDFIKRLEEMSPLPPDIQGKIDNLRALLQLR